MKKLIPLYIVIVCSVITVFSIYRIITMVTTGANW